jgi:hypothetical protein
MNIDKSIFNKAVKRIAVLTQDNNHCEALIVGSELLQMTKMVNILGHVKAIQAIEQCLPDGLSEYRWNLYKQIMEKAFSSLSKEDYELFHGAY